MGFPNRDLPIRHFSRNLDDNCDSFSLKLPEKVTNEETPILRPPHVMATETMLAETMLADSRARVARVCWCTGTCCTCSVAVSIHVKIHE